MGTTTFTLTESSGSTMVFGAPATAGGNNFSSWSGCTSVSGANCTVSVSGNVTITANYVTPVAPTVTVTPSASTITTAQALSVTVAVAASQGGATPTGSIVLTSGSYTSRGDDAEQRLGDDQHSGGNAGHGDRFAEGDLHAGLGEFDCLHNVLRHRLGDGQRSGRTDRDGDAVSDDNYDRAGALGDGCGGCVAGRRDADRVGRLDERKLYSAATTLSNGSATISVPAGLPVGTDSLKATYTPDSASSSCLSNLLRHCLGDGHPAPTGVEPRSVLIEHHNDSTADGDHQRQWHADTNGKRRAEQRNLHIPHYDAERRRCRYHCACGLACRGLRHADGHLHSRLGQFLHLRQRDEDRLGYGVVRHHRCKFKPGQRSQYHRQS